MRSHCITTSLSIRPKTSAIGGYSTCSCSRHTSKLTPIIRAPLTTSRSPTSISSAGTKRSNTIRPVRPWKRVRLSSPLRPPSDPFAHSLLLHASCVTAPGTPDPDRYRSYYLIGKCLENLKRPFSEQRAAYERAHSICAAPEPLFLIARHYWYHEKDLDTAWAFASRAADARPDPACHTHIDTLLIQEQLPALINTLKQARKRAKRV
jgi:hypothetical protein